MKTKILSKFTAYALALVLLLSGCASSPAESTVQTKVPELTLPGIQVDLTEGSGGETHPAATSGETSGDMTAPADTSAAEPTSEDAPTEEQTSEEVTTEGVTTEEATTEEATTEEVTTEEVTTEEVTTEEPTTEEPTTVEPTTEEPTTEEPTTEEATTAEPTTADNTAAKLFASLLSEAGMTEETLSGSQLIIVKSVGTGCRVYFYEKGDGGWSAVSGLAMSAGFVGQNGVGDAHEGSKLTPKGYYALGPAFGRDADPGIDMDYFQISENDFWVDDIYSPYYNQHVNTQETEQNWKSAEDLHRLMEEGYYQYSVFIRYNTDPVVPGKGSAFFLHCGGVPTSGCVALPEAVMVRVFDWLSASCDPHILIY